MRILKLDERERLSYWALVGDVLHIAIETSLGAVAAVLNVTELLASVTIRDVLVGVLVLHFNQQVLQLCEIKDVPLRPGSLDLLVHLDN